MYIKIERTNKLSLVPQIHEFIKSAIFQGTLRAHEKLPSSRELAKSLNISRNVIIESYEQLIAEGYAYSKNGAGTFICAGLQFQRNSSPTNITISPIKPALGSKTISFRTGIPDLENIPLKKWAHIYQQLALDSKPTHLAYQDAQGDYALRTQISRYLNRMRGACTCPENIIITNGAAQAFNLLTVLVSDIEYALLENPLSTGLLHTLKSNNLQLQPIALDAYGLKTTALPAKPPKLIFTTPSHQFPTGIILPAARRIELVKYAQQHNSFIVEDDYDSEFRFDGHPIQALQYLAPEQVIYVGTFSKTLMPALRIGYMVLPPSLTSKLVQEKYLADIHSPILEQKTLAKFIEAGHFERHLRKMRKIYLKKRNHLIKCLQDFFADQVIISGAEAGLHFIASFPDLNFEPELLRKIAQKGLEITPLSQYFFPSKETPHCNNSLLFGYGNTSLSEITVGIERLATVIQNHKL
ncbi:PLP-dependent aminotransferase family protein [Succinispira mobilis]|uniref:MocR-like pyridoxine biosynthesis transcription factor PdxR n=1 Tax=Succinispira mobilis TaxID=78120 RepID=UPI000360D8CF|nr:PLP-dependent aminotransferase family protein [Succinispira mobilis]